MTLRQQSGIRAGRIIADLIAVNLAWIGAFYIRFFTFMEAPLGVPAQHLYFKLLPFIAIIWFLQAVRTPSLGFCRRLRYYLLLSFCYFGFDCFFIFLRRI